MEYGLSNLYKQKYANDTSRQAVAPQPVAPPPSAVSSTFQGAKDGAAGGAPGVAISAGVGLLKGLLEMKAAKEQQRRQLEVQALQGQKDAMENMANKNQDAFGALMNKYGSLIS